MARADAANVVEQGSIPWRISSGARPSWALRGAERGGRRSGEMQGSIVGRECAGAASIQPIQVRDAPVAEIQLIQAYNPGCRKGSITGA
jgi:hypothetical protein